MASDEQRLQEVDTDYGEAMDRYAVTAVAT
jgi:hypothetical protein